MPCSSISLNTSVMPRPVTTESPDSTTKAVWREYLNAHICISETKTLLLRALDVVDSNLESKTLKPWFVEQLSFAKQEHLLRN